MSVLLTSTIPARPQVLSGGCLEFAGELELNFLNISHQADSDSRFVSENVHKLPNRFMS